jgi:hypothetical protein
MCTQSLRAMLHGPANFAAQQLPQPSSSPVPQHAITSPGELAAMHEVSFVQLHEVSDTANVPDLRAFWRRIVDPGCISIASPAIRAKDADDVESL